MLYIIIHILKDEHLGLLYIIIRDRSNREYPNFSIISILSRLNINIWLIPLRECLIVLNSVGLCFRDIVANSPCKCGVLPGIYSNFLQLVFSTNYDSVFCKSYKRKRPIIGPFPKFLCVTILRYSSCVNITVRQSRQSGVARATCPD